MSMLPQNTVIAGFSSRDMAFRAVDELLSSGFSDGQFDLAVRDKPSSPGSATLVSGTGGAGGLAGVLVDAGLSEETARRYDAKFQAAEAVLVVRTEDRAADATRILNDFNARIEGADDSVLRGYGSTAGTRESLGLPADTDTDQIGALTGRQHSWDEVHPTLRAEWEHRSHDTSLKWQDVEPGYRYGHEMASKTTYRDRRWDEVEPELRLNYPVWSREHGYDEEADESIWEKIKDAVADSWQRATRGTDETATTYRAEDRPVMTEHQERGHWVPWRGEYSGSMHAEPDAPTRGDSVEP